MIRAMIRAMIGIVLIRAPAERALLTLTLTLTINPKPNPKY